MAEVGYIRVSTLDQHTDRQLPGVDLEKVFEEKASARDAKRPKLTECLEYLREGDTLHVHSIDRLARNLQDLLGILKELTGRGVSVRFHKEGLTFNGQQNPMQELQLQIIGAVVQFEIALIRERQREGIAKAKQKGKHLGRASKLTKEQALEIKARVEAGEDKQTLAQEYGVSRFTVYRALQKIDKSNR